VWSICTGSDVRGKKIHRHRAAETEIRRRQIAQHARHTANFKAQREG